MSTVYDGTAATMDGVDVCSRVRQKVCQLGRERCLETGHAPAILRDKLRWTGTRNIAPTEEAGT